MKITLMYNPQAGGSDLPVESLKSGLIRRGGDVFTQGTKEEDYQEALKRECDFILIAGGDGTIEKIARKIVHKQVPIAILPFGNANNIALSLDVDTRLDAIVSGWKNKNFSRLSVGSIRFEQKSMYFFEAVGCGLFAEVLHEIRQQKKAGEKKSRNEKNKVESGLSRLRQAIKVLQPTYYRLVADGIDYSGHYLWVEIMNTQSMGPRLQMAPGATHGDQFLDLVLVGEDDKEAAERFLKNQNKEGNGHDFKTIKARNLRFKSQEPIHVDDEILLGTEVPGEWLEVSLLPQFLRVINA